MTYQQKGKQRTEPRKQKTHPHTQNSKNKAEILVHMQEELHFHLTHSKKHKETREKHKLIVLQKYQHNKPRGPNTATEKHQKKHTNKQSRIRPTHTQSNQFSANFFSRFKKLANWQLPIFKIKKSETFHWLSYPVPVRDERLNDTEHFNVMHGWISEPMRCHQIRGYQICVF